MPKIRSIDAVLRGSNHAQDRIREGHPELSFALMNGNTPLLSKKKDSGIKQRLELVEHCVGIRVKPGTPHLEDVLDACALLWTARRVRLGKEQSFPEVAEFDRYGLRMKIAA